MTETAQKTKSVLINVLKNSILHHFRSGRLHFVINVKIVVPYCLGWQLEKKTPEMTIFFFPYSTTLPGEK